jgi:hydrogenase expression/formation protein HypC
MSVGVPGKIIAIENAEAGRAEVEFANKREIIDISCLLLTLPAEKLVGRWVIVEQGFALALIDEAQAEQMLLLLSELRLDRDKSG